MWKFLEAFTKHVDDFKRDHDAFSIGFKEDMDEIKVASKAIKSLVAVVHAFVVQQCDELKQKRKVQRLSKKLDKKTKSLHLVERKHVEVAS
ncbi:hypothetical protein GOP47_0024509 [Adiantum capillus-veneris]|uniref:Uncharacterized protein n=1 Tax=Adiantum capillus-veneris TaxID=13818 RepID=A0A9D4U473_ADICA|nr:hypothetical protein GOP47_0024509 [Adiantum capillus-veneris]